MASFELAVKGPYELSASAEFLCGFTPAAGGSACAAGRLRLGLLCESDFTPAVFALSQRGAQISVETPQKIDVAAVTRQLARTLSIDRDATSLARVAERDAVVARAFAERPGFRPVCFASAYEAALWGVLSQRTPMRLAAQLKRKLAERTGAVVRAWGDEFTLAPPPARLLSLRTLAGLPQHKLERCHAIAEAALSGALDTERLRRLDQAAALAELETLPGVGPWTAELILLRGAGVQDALPRTEPRVFEAVGHAYGLGRAASADELSTIAEGWRPFRMWLSVLFVSRWMRGATGASRSRPSKRRERGLRTACA